MLKNILKLKGAQELTKNAQKLIKGAIQADRVEIWCFCSDGIAGSLGLISEKSCLLACRGQY